MIVFLVGCSAEPVYIADEIAPGELWNFETAVPEMSGETKELPCGDGIVYYTESGSVWHTSPDCSSLSRSTNVMSGTVEQATADGMDRACKRCGG